MGNLKILKKKSLEKSNPTEISVFSDVAVDYKASLELGSLVFNESGYFFVLCH